MSEETELVREFLVETFENLQKLDSDLMALEQANAGPDTIHRIFRCIHTIKGTCGFLGFGITESLAHKGEHLLDRIRSGAITISSDHVTALLELIDAIRQVLSSIEATGVEDSFDYSALLTKLTRLSDGDDSSASFPTIVSTVNETIELADSPVIELKPESILTSATPLDIADIEAVMLAANKERMETLAAANSNQSAPSTQTSIQQPSEGNSTAMTESSTNPPPVAPVSAQQDKTPAATSASADSNSTLAESSLRVDVAVLDRLMNLVGELVLTRNQILQLTRSDTGSELSATAQRLDLITTDLQEGVMKTRMQPIANVWNKFPRIVRDISKGCGKQVRVEMEGKETELDKTIIEAIKDPLTHIIRNSIDHGIEAPEERVAAGKPSEGELRLRAFHEGGNVIIEVVDDGKGLNCSRIRSKAVEKGLMRQEEADKLSEQDTWRLIFAAGFSTAEKVTNISGRGVGMDVVKSNIEKIGGMVDVSSIAGRGTTLRLRIPLTLAIVPALLVSAANQRFAIPQASLTELVRVLPENTAKEIEEIRGIPFYRLRGKLLQLVDLDRLLTGPEAKPLHQRLAEEGNSINIVVVSVDGNQFGIMVERVHDTEEIVVKALDNLVKNVGVYAGATIMGDGRVALILDVLGIARHARTLSEAAKNETRRASVADVKNEETQTFLVVQAGPEQRAALPLTMVNRLEEIPRSQIETVCGATSIQYRGDILPLLHLSDLIGCSSVQPPEVVSVVVCQRQDKQLGLIVERIIDIAEEHVEMHSTGKSNGVIGAAVMQGKITALIDPESVFASTAY